MMRSVFWKDCIGIGEERVNGRVLCMCAHVFVCVGVLLEVGIWLGEAPALFGQKLMKV